MTRITFISTMAGNPWGGSEELWVAMAKKATQKGHIVAASVYDWNPLDNRIKSLKEIGVKLYLRNRIAYPKIIGKIKGKLTQLLIAEKQLNDFIVKTSPELLIVSMGSFADLEINPFRNFLLKLKVPYELIVHVNMESHSIASNKIEEVRKCCQKAKRVLFVSNRLKEIAERQIAFEFPNARIIANPVNMDEIGILPFPENKIIQMAMVGRIQVNIKGQALLLQILAQDKWRNRKWHLNIYGQGPDKQLIEELIDLYQLKNQVTLHGQVKDIRKDIWAKNHILLMPSYYEGMPLALIEAMLSGCTAVVSDVGGASELIKNNIEGFIAEGNTLYSFDKAMEIAWENKSLWQGMGERAFITANDYFYSNAMENVFTELILN